MFTLTTSLKTAIYVCLGNILQDTLQEAAKDTDMASLQQKLQVAQEIAPFLQFLDNTGDADLTISISGNTDSDNTVASREVASVPAVAEKVEAPMPKNEVPLHLQEVISATAGKVERVYHSLQDVPLSAAEKTMWEEGEFPPDITTPNKKIARLRGRCLKLIGAADFASLGYKSKAAFIREKAPWAKSSTKHGDDLYAWEVKADGVMHRQRLYRASEGAVAAPSEPKEDPIMAGLQGRVEYISDKDIAQFVKDHSCTREQMFQRKYSWSVGWAKSDAGYYLFERTSDRYEVIGRLRQAK
jgi:hypothetical protein